MKLWPSASKTELASARHPVLYLPSPSLSLAIGSLLWDLHESGLQGHHMQATRGLHSSLNAWYNCQYSEIQACADCLGKCEVLVANYADL